MLNNTIKVAVMAQLEYTAGYGNIFQDFNPLFSKS